jgi:hypothetical protein
LLSKNFLAEANHCSSGSTTNNFKDKTPPHALFKLKLIISYRLDGQNDE